MTRELEVFSQVGTIREYRAGDIVFALGETGKEMYLVSGGEVEIELPGGRSKRLGKGEFFGELAFIMGEHRRTASVRAATASQLVVIDENAVERLTHTHPALLFAILRRSCAYLLRAEQRLVTDLQMKNEEYQQTLDYLRATKEELDYQELLAQTDQLTGLYNRRCFDAQLQKFIDRLDPTSTNRLALLVIDLDEFKPLNDTCGHDAGDRVLEQVGAILKRHSRKTDLPCRLGGDEFAVLLTEVKLGMGPLIGDRIREAVETLPLSTSLLRVTASLGGTTYRHGESAAQFCKRADLQLYQAKGSGRNRVCFEEE